MPSWTLSQMTESGMCIMHADSYLVETIGCLNNILDLFFNFFFNLLCGYKVYVINNECSHLKEKITH